ncbi:MAG: sigma-70 family RNA polymerase sigma factor [Tepidisphaerales bacterium]
MSWSTPPTSPGGSSPSASPVDDYTLMERVAAGDRAAFDQLYGRYAPLVYSLALRICGDRGAAEDLLIDIFFELWQRAERYDPERGAPLTYITTLARSRAIDRKRGKAGRWSAVQREEGGDGLAELDGADGSAPSPPEVAALAEQAGAVRAALFKLDPEHRQLLELSYFEGLSHTQIAERVGKPLGTVKTHIRMGIIRLRELLRIRESGDRSSG